MVYIFWVLQCTVSKLHTSMNFKMGIKLFYVSQVNTLLFELVRLLDLKAFETIEILYLFLLE